MPWVSSSKKRSKPALAAGMGALFSRFFCLLPLLLLNGLSPKLYSGRVYLINVVLFLSLYFCRSPYSPPLLEECFIDVLWSV